MKAWAKTLLFGACAALASSVSALGQTTYSYDELGRIKKATYTDGSFIEYSYDANDNRTLVGTSGPPPSFSINDVSVLEGGSLVFTVTKSGSTLATINVSYATANGSAGGGDYTATSGVLTFGPSDPSKTITVTTTQDAIYELAETVLVNLSSATGGATIVDGQGVGTITNDDAGPTFSVSDVTAAEGGVLAFLVTKNGLTSQSHGVSYATANGTATAGADYTATSGSLTFASNETQKTVPVTTIQDGVAAEPAETMFLNLSAATNGASIADGQGVGTINNVNSAPTDISPNTSLVAENSANGSSVVTFTAADPDAGDTATFTLTNTAGGRFAIAAGGQLTVANGSLLNYEAATSHTITVRATDTGGLWREENIVVSVTNVNEPPTDISPNSAAVAENAANGTVVVNLSRTDPEVGDAATYSLSDSAGGRFAVSSGGQLTVANGGLLNYEAATGHTVRVRVTDGGGLWYEENIAVSVNNVNEAPTDIAPNSGSVAETTSIGATVLTFSRTDPDAGDTASYSLTNTAGGRFSVTSGGLLQVASALGAATSHTITVRVTDGGGLIRDENVVLTVNRRPTLQAVWVGFVMYVCTMTQFTTADPEGDTLTVTWRGALVTASHPGNSILTGCAAPDVLAPYLYNYNLPVGSSGVLALTDPAGNTSSYTITRTGSTTIVFSPIVLDLDGDGVELVSYAASGVGFDVDGAWGLERTGWVGGDDGLLALDRDGDGLITSGAEISFVNDLPGARTDLEGLRAYDINADGLFDAVDERFGEFLVWRDADQNGVSGRDELFALADLGIQAIDLAITPTGASVEGAADNVVTGVSRFIRVDGSEGEIADASFLYQTPELRIDDDSVLDSVADAFTPVRSDDVASGAPARVGGGAR